LTGHPAHPVTSGHRSRHSGFALSINATQALAALAPKLIANQARQAVPPVLGAIHGATDPDVLEALGQGLAALAPKLTPEQARPAVAPVLAAMEHTTAPAALEVLGNVLATLARQLTAEQAWQSGAPVLDAMQGPTTRILCWSSRPRSWRASARGSPRLHQS
jgi:hypothetical protein